jgi:hypothetical protein
LAKVKWDQGMRENAGTKCKRDLPRASARREWQRRLFRFHLSLAAGFFTGDRHLVYCSVFIDESMLREIAQREMDRIVARVHG